MRARASLNAVILALLMTAAASTRAAAAGDVRIDDLCRAVNEDGNYKVRVQAALVLGKLGDARAVQPLIKALGDQNKSVRGIAASALGQLGDGAAVDPLRDLLRRESDPFVRGQAEKAMAALSGGGAGGKRAKIYVNFGAFVGGVKSAGPESSKILHEALSRELGKLAIVTLTLSPTEQHNFGKSGMSGFYIDGNITKLEDSGGNETSCDVKVMVARWPQKSIIMWTNAGASVQSGSRPRDKENARRDCLEASARGLSEDLVNFLKQQGG
ncbi:MAG TPA: HEAT repeat domain-containing protein [Polyangia bacterium]